MTEQAIKKSQVPARDLAPHDPVGNMPAGFELMQSSGWSFACNYDPAGNRTLQNAGGALTTYIWDFEGRVSGIVLPAGTSVTMTYLPNNRPLKLSDIHGNPTTLTYDIGGANLVRRDVGGSSPATERYIQPSKDFGGQLAQVTTAATGARFYLADLNDNIGLLAARTSAIDSHTFEAFGVPVSGGTPTVQPFGYGGDAGYYTEPIGGLPILWNRIYDTNVGQFPSRDPIGFRGGDWESLYRYVKNNPMGWVDPSGTDLLTAGIGAGIGASVSLIVNVCTHQSLCVTTCETISGGIAGGIAGALAEAGPCVVSLVNTGITTFGDQLCGAICSGQLVHWPTPCDYAAYVVNILLGCAVPWSTGGRAVDEDQVLSYVLNLFDSAFGVSCNAYRTYNH